MPVPKSSLYRLVFLACLLVLMGLPVGAWAKPRPVTKPLAKKVQEDRMSSMGRLAVRARAAITATGGHLTAKGIDDGGNCGNDAECEADDTDGPAGGQAEVSIAVDITGQHVVIGFNDTRGFANNPTSVSGVMYSDDGGVTFVDGGQLPSPGNDSIGGTLLPIVLGDADIKYLGGCNFVYSSILIKKFSPTTTAQTMGVHRSTDCGHTWTGPFEVTSATNPNGLVSGSGAPRDTADKEFTDVDPITGRVILSWTNFTPAAPGGVEIATTYSDNVLTGNPPTWSPRAVVSAVASDGQSSIPRFAGILSNNAYTTWRRFPFPGTLFGYGNTIAFSRSTDNGAHWSAPIELGSEFFTADQQLGNDRNNTSPGMAVDNSVGPHSGNIYVVYANNNLQDGSDVVVQRSTDKGLTFSAPLRLNSRPGNDRSQWFPWVTVDWVTGRVWVFYYDQGIAASGEASETTVTYSDDGGVHWSAPVPLTSRPFLAGWGNDTGQPNLGDYNQAVAQWGELFSAYAVASRPPLGFADGQPSGALTVPDISFRRVPQFGSSLSPASHAIPTVPVSLANVAVNDSNHSGFVDPDETVNLKLTLSNYVTNPISADRITGTTARLSTTTPGVTVTQDQSPYANMDPGSSSVNKKDFVLKTSPSFVPGTPIELALDVRSSEHGAATLLYTLFTGTPVPTTLFSENFNSVAPGTLPAGWVTSHGGGSNVVPWKTSSTYCGTGSNGAFHVNANDAASPTRWERLFSPPVVVPANAEYVTLDFDVCYDTEDDPNFSIQAYDGFFVRITDLTPTRPLRSVLAEAFQDEFTTGSFLGYPKHFPRSSNSAYFQDMSAWAGDSHGVQHVHMRLPGMAGSTFQLRFEYTQDGGSICSDVRPGHSCGVLLDNVVIKSVVSAPN